MESANRNCHSRNNYCEETPPVPWERETIPVLVPLPQNRSPSQSHDRSHSNTPSFLSRRQHPASKGRQSRNGSESTSHELTFAAEDSASRSESFQSYGSSTEARHSPAASTREKSAHYRSQSNQSQAGSNGEPRKSESLARGKGFTAVLKDMFKRKPVDDTQFERIDTGGHWSEN